MEYIPTANEPKELKQAYKEAYGDTAYDYQHDNYDVLEFRLLNDAYQEKFKNEGVSLFAAGFFLPEVNIKIRACLETGIPYEYPYYPEDVLL